jgi:hypothetical protein
MKKKDEMGMRRSERGWCQATQDDEAGGSPSVGGPATARYDLAFLSAPAASATVSECDCPILALS